MVTGRKGEDSGLAHLELLGGFRLTVGGTPRIPPAGARRFLALMALDRHPHSRQRVAGILWPDRSETRAAASLRSALWRLRQIAEEVIEASQGQLRLADEVSTDVEEVEEAAARLLQSPEAVDLVGVEASMFVNDLLPEWYDDWLLLERERVRQLRLHALEALSDRLLTAGRFAEAVMAALAAVRAEPLRESANRSLIRAHIAEGNPSEAVRQYRAFCRLLADELGVSPSGALASLVAGLTRR